MRPRARVAAFRNRVQDLLVEVRPVLHRGMPAVGAVRTPGPKLPVEFLARATLAAAHVEGIRVEPQEAHQAEELGDPVLNGGASEAPPPVSYQSIGRAARAVGAPFHLVGLVQDQAPPPHAVQQGPAQVDLCM